MDLEKLKKIGQDIEVKQVRSNIQAEVLKVLKKETKDGKSKTQKELANIVGKVLNRTIRPQHIRSVCLTLRKQGRVKRLVLKTPDEGGNTHFWYWLK